MSKKNNIEEIELNLEGATGFYALDLPQTGITIEPNDLAHKHNIFGQFAVVQEVKKGVFEAARDPLGIGKMFYTVLENGQLSFSSQWMDLVSHGQPIYSLPKGKLVRLSNKGERALIQDLTPQSDLNLFSDQPEKAGSQNFDQLPELGNFKKLLHNRLDSAFKLISSLERSGFSIFIALSGGLDSSIIANFSKRHLKNPVACTLDLGKSEDAEKSALIAQKLGIQHEIFHSSKEDILDALKESPALSQDYRDFNVHCTALNVLLAKNIAQLAKKRGVAKGKAIILTGDTMNEFTCDYHSEEVDGTIYYRLPRVKAKMLQQVLINGLETSDRELLPFLRYGLSCIQPYAVTYDLYSAIPEYLLEIEDIKRYLNDHLVPAGTLDLLPKSKLRAQVGSKENMGVLGLCHREGITEQTFLKNLTGLDDAEKSMVPITMGGYEKEVFSD